ncbi:hypothetical protein L596_009594 [Steinernema carpocapsae]|uniref:Uncharacterized protein n=1 Tax=Steinernema carpocapsae TaxID=34508 RepID=A0A4U5PFU2_STECR|nr:hypothetical protein L596_009594 [Steinernema carpocapsae]
MRPRRSEKSGNGAKRRPRRRSPKTPKLQGTQREGPQGLQGQGRKAFCLFLIFNFKGRKAKISEAISRQDHGGFSIRQIG